jgi:thiamine pyrophosphokinase
MRVVVVASGDIDPGDEEWLDGAGLVFAADGGGMSLDRLGRRPDRLVGDLDSISDDLVQRLEASGVPVDHHPADKEASDTELAIAAALEAGATQVILLGGLGGERVDHALANLLILADPGLRGRDVRLVHGATTVRVVHGGEQMTLVGTPGDLVTLLAIGIDATGVTTAGLRWALTAAVLRAGRSRGLSNEVVTTPASVLLERGTLLVVETANEGAHIT